MRACKLCGGETLEDELYCGRYEKIIGDVMADLRAELGVIFSGSYIAAANSVFSIIIAYCQRKPSLEIGHGSVQDMQSHFGRDQRPTGAVCGVYSG